MPHPFRRLPAPILLDIIKLLPSLPCVDQLKRASAAVSDMFEECSAEIVAAVIRPLPQELQRVICAVAVALSVEKPQWTDVETRKDVETRRLLGLDSQPGLFPGESLENQVIPSHISTLSDRRPDPGPRLDLPVSNMSSALDGISIGPMTKDSIPRHLPLSQRSCLHAFVYRVSELGGGVPCHARALWLK